MNLGGFSPDDDVIVADIGAMMAKSDLSIESRCHSGGEFCEVFFSSVGIDFASGDLIDKQTVFRAESK